MELPHLRGPKPLPLVRMEWKNGSNSSYNCTPFLHSLLTKGKNPELECRTTALNPMPGRPRPVAPVEFLPPDR